MSFMWGNYDGLEPFAEGAQHSLYDIGEGLIDKVPKAACEYTTEEVIKALEYANDMFGAFSPSTEIKTSGDRYVIRQEKVIGKTLSDLNPNEFSSDTLDGLSEIVSIYREILKTEKFNFDLIGQQSFHHNKPTFSQDYSNKLSYGLARGKFAAQVFKTPIFDSTNLMLHDDERLLLVDNVFVANPGGQEIYPQLSFPILSGRKLWGKINQYKVSKQKKRLAS